VKYCAALANEGGGAIVLGIGNTRPRVVVGSQAFSDLPRTTHDLLQKLHLRIQVDEATHDGKRVVAFVVPPRPVGVPIEVNGTYWMRAGESLTAMTSDMLRRIFDEAAPDFSAELCRDARLEDLDPDAVLAFRRAWARKAASKAIEQAPVPQLLEDAELLVDGKLTHAALVLFGTRKALGGHLPQAEVVFEYRTGETTGPAQQRLDLRAGFFACHDQIWQAIAARNELQHFREGLFVWDVQTFEEASLRELVLNAVAHRDYRLHGSVFVVQYPRNPDRSEGRLDAKKARQRDRSLEVDPRIICPTPTGSDPLPRPATTTMDNYLCVSLRQAACLPGGSEVSLQSLGIDLTQPRVECRAYAKAL
jgi:ATP-dependent DNA helicase RecG